MTSAIKLGNKVPLPILTSTLSSYKSPLTRVTSLGHGLRVATQTFDSELATVGVRINSGSRDDPKSGTANLLNRLTKRKLDSQFGSSGAKITSYTNREHTVYNVTVLRENAKDALSTLEEAVRNPLLDTQSVEAERASLLCQIEGSNKHHQQKLFQYLHRTAFMDSGLGNSPEGTEEGVKSITVGDLESFRNSHVVKSNLVALGAGSVDHETFIHTTSSVLGNLSDSPVPAFTPSIYVGSDIQYRFDSMREAHVAIAFEAAPANSTEAFTFKLLQSILGSWNLASVQNENIASRLGQELSENHCATSHEAFNFSYKDTGLFGVKVTGEPRLLEDTMYYVAYNIARLAHDVCEEEVERAKNQLKTKLLLNLADPEHAVNDMGWQLFAHDRRISSAEVAARIDAISLADVTNTANKYLNDEDHVLAAVGPIYGLPDYNWIRRKSFWIRF